MATMASFLLINRGGGSSVRRHVPSASIFPKSSSSSSSLLICSTKKKKISLKRRMWVAVSAKTTPLIEKETTDNKKNGGGGVWDEFKTNAKSILESEKVRFVAQAALQIVVMSVGNAVWIIRPRIGDSVMELNLLSLLVPMVLPFLRMIGLQGTLKTTISTGSLDLTEGKKDGSATEKATLNHEELFLKILPLLFRAENVETAKKGMDYAWGSFIDMKGIDVKGIDEKEKEG